MAVGAGLGMGVGVGAGLGMGVGVGAGLGMVGWLAVYLLVHQFDVRRPFPSSVLLCVPTVTYFCYLLLSLVFSTFYDFAPFFFHHFAS